MNTASTKQQEIIDFRGHLLVKAPPGSGKTYTLTKKIEMVQSESQKKIIALTFSNKAAEELSERISNKKNVETSTIHSYCQDLVLSRAHLIGLNPKLRIISEESDKLFIIKSTIRNSSYLTSKIKDTSDDYLKKISNFISVQKSRFINPHFFKKDDKLHSKLYYEIYSGYVNSMLSQNLIDFDDLLFYAYQILSLKETKSLFSRLYGHVYVDEAQDLNMAQYEIVKLLISFVDDSMLIGDPDQSLYKFMGSNKNIMTRSYVRDFNASTIILNENYRSAKSIVNLINELNDSNESTSKYPLEGEVRFNLYNDEFEESISIVDKIEELLIQTEPENIAVLGRNIYVLNFIKDELQKRSISYNIGLASKVIFESDDAELFFNLLKLMDNPSNNIVVNDLNNFLGSNYLDVDLLLKKISQEYELIYNSADKSFKNLNFFLREIDSLIKHFNNSNYTDELKYLIINDFEYIRENWLNYSKKNSSKSILKFMNDMTLGKTQNSDINGISLLTVHKSKGLEFDTTFVVGLNEGTLPDYRSNESNIDEENNNAYVAFSRAKRNCFISAVIKKKMPWEEVRYQKVSRYIYKVKSVLDTDVKL